MSELDVAKERIAYFKLWLGIMVVTDISLIGWLFVNYGRVSVGLLIVDLLAIIGVGITILAIHRRINRKIEHLREL